MKKLTTPILAGILLCISVALPAFSATSDAKLPSLSLTEAIDLPATGDIALLAASMTDTEVTGPVSEPSGPRLYNSTFGPQVVSNEGNRDAPILFNSEGNRGAPLMAYQEPVLGPRVYNSSGVSNAEDTDFRRRQVAVAPSKP